MDLHSRDVKQDVHELGALLGDVLAEQTSQESFETVEDIRTTAIDYRKGERQSRTELDDRIGGLSPDDESVVARAFTTYFELINLAEERERARVDRVDRLSVGQRVPGRVDVGPHVAPGFDPGRTVSIRLVTGLWLDVNLPIGGKRLEAVHEGM